MPDPHNPQDNDVVSQTVSLPISYLNYLSRKRINFNSDLTNKVIPTNRLCLFPGIKIEVQNQENINVSIDELTLPPYCKKFQMQTIILNALLALESISNASADAIKPQSQEKMAILIQDALEKCLLIDPFTEMKNIAIWVTIVAASILALSCLVLYAMALFTAIPPMVFAAILVASTVLYAVATIRGLANMESVLNQADTVYSELANVVETVCVEIAKKAGSSPTVPDKEAKQVSFSEAKDQFFGGKNHGIYTLAGQQTAPANSPEQPTTEQERAPTMTFKS